MQETDITKLCQDILERWALLALDGRSAQLAEDVDVQLARLMESQALTTSVRNSNYTEEEKRIRESILSQYGQYSDDEGDRVAAPGCAQSSALEKNCNAALVAQAEREKREQSKLESQKKKEKDKEDR